MKKEDGSFLSYDLLQKLIVILKNCDPSDLKSSELFYNITTDMNDSLNRKINDDAKYSDWVIDLWKKPLQHLELFLIISKDLLGIIINETKPDENKINLFEVLIRLHGKSCQVTEEILLLMKYGYADGALSRWRTLHEVYVTMEFISKYGEDVAKRYLDYEIVESSKILKQYKCFQDILNLEPFSKEEENEIKESIKKMKNDYGDDFTKPYGWARHALNKKNKERVTFAELEKEISLDFLRPHYKLASHAVHAEPKGTMFKLGLVTVEEDMILTVPTDMGLADPGQNTAITMFDINNILLNFLEHDRKDLITGIMTYFMNETRDEFL